jgi:hypothetical protein
VSTLATRVLAFAVAASLASMVSMAACTSGDVSSSSSGSAATCPDDLPAACPSVAPSYAKDVATVIEQACAPCHAPGGQQASRPLVTYAGAFANRSAMLNQVHACRMPPLGSPPLSADGRKLLQEWLVCGAPNN